MMTRLRNILFGNVALKFAALVIAFLMWYGVANDPKAIVAMNIPIEFVNMPDNLDFSSDVLPQAQLRLRGPVRVLRELSDQDVHAMVDLKGAKPGGEQTYALAPDQIHVPQGVEVTQISPARVRLTFDARVTRDVPIKPRVIGTFASGYRIESSVAQPDTVTITGPARRVNSIENATTDPVDATGVVGTSSFETRPFVADPLVRISNPHVVHVVVTTQKADSKAGVP